ncbi:MAG: HepT-like ribonuclease domain-containing protein [Phycisphaeraceae bacterium]
MRPEDSDQARLWDIVRWGERLNRLMAGVSWEQYAADEEKQIAVERCIEVIGEAARHLSEPFKLDHDDIPWRAIIQQRNVIAHGYFVLEHDRPKLVERIAPLISDPPSDPDA